MSETLFAYLFQLDLSRARAYLQYFEAAIHSRLKIGPVRAALNVFKFKPSFHRTYFILENLTLQDSKIRPLRTDETSDCPIFNILHKPNFHFRHFCIFYMIQLFYGHMTPSRGHSSRDKAVPNDIKPCTFTFCVHFHLLGHLRSFCVGFYHLR